MAQARRRASGSDDISAGQVLGWLRRRLSEMGTALGLMCVLAAGAAIGVVVPQGLAPEDYVGRYGHAMGRLVLLTGLDRAFTAWWFLLPAAALAASLIACSRRLWRLSAARWRIPDAAGAARRLVGAEVVARAYRAGSPGQALTELATAARRWGYATYPLGGDGQAQWLFLCRRRWAHWGTTLAHYSLFLVAIGAALGCLPGISLDMQIRVLEGETYRDPQGRLPFDLRVDGFEIRRDTRTGAVENYYSDVTLIEEGREKVRQRVAVNHSLARHGVIVTQASWGIAGVQIEVTDGKGDRTRVVEFPVVFDEEHGGWSFQPGARAVLLPDGETALMATGLAADAERRGDQVLDRGGGALGTPALSLATAIHSPEGGIEMRPLTVLLEGESVAIPGGQARFVKALVWTGLGARRDPGLALVFLGFTGCVLGMVLIFYLRPERATGRLAVVGEGFVEILIATPAGLDVPAGTATRWERIVATSGAWSQTPPAAAEEEASDER